MMDIKNITPIIIILTTLVLLILLNKKSIISYMENITYKINKHKSDQYYTFRYLQDLYSQNKYLDEPSLSVYDEELKKHDRKIKINL